MSRTSIRKAAFGSVAFSALSLAGVANAQDQETVPPVDVVEIPEEAEEEARQEKVVVTGSLLARDSFSSASPIQVITAEVATLEGLVDAAELLQGSSLASGSTQLNNTFQNFVTNGGVGTQTLDLRGCGDTRTLVLVDGKRPGPSGTRGTVSALDLNVVPQSIISRVEILKDGASTIYGSDAVCGVVNIITRDSVDGFELNGSLTQPEESGGEQYRISAAYGFEMGDNADFTLSAEYRLSEELDTSQRSFLECERDYVRDPNNPSQLLDRLNFSATATDPRVACSNLYHNTAIDAFSGERLIPSPDGSTGPTAFGGTIPGYRPRVGTGVNPDGSLFYEDILDAPFLDNQDFIPKNTNIAIFGTADIELGSMAWDTEFLYSQRKTEVEGWRQFFPFVGSLNTPFGPLPQYGYISDPTYSNPLNSLVRPVMPYPTFDEITVDYYYLSSSLSGGFGSLLDGWSWKVDGTHSIGKGSYEGNEILASRSGDWGLDGVVDYTGDGIPDTVAPPSINFLDPDILSGANVAALVNAVGGVQTGNTEYEQTTFTGVIAGEVFDLPAGPVGLGIGAEYREFSVDDQPGVLTQGGDIWGSSTAGPTVGDNSVTEVFAEVNVPIFKGQPFAEDVEFSGSVRAFDYEFGGSDSIYKVGLNWQINPVFRARTSFGTSYRAPALFEIALEEQTSFLSQTAIDPCVNYADPTQNRSANVQANCASLGIPGNYQGAGSSALIVESGGGDRLNPETGESFTAGLIFTPTFANINIAIDYYEIDLADQITTLGAGTIANLCYGQSTFPNDFCTFITRNPGTAPGTSAFSITQVESGTVNVNAQNQRGVDLEFRYENDLNIGTVVVEGSVNWALERFIQVFGSDFLSGVANNDFNGSIGFPNTVGDVSLRLDRGDWTYTWFTDYTGRQDDNRYYAADLNTPQPYLGGLVGQFTANTEAEFRHGASVRWQGDTWSITGGIRNIFDEEPPLVSPDFVQTSAGNVALQATGYDVRGRRAFVNVSKVF